ncbi:MAG: DUF433 domain-containing protein [Anaerolineales bacterium]|nr:DUF433 domain-containing protein [Anaerolineales bacterium]
MDTPTLLQRITIDPEICHGNPCIRGLRYPVDCHSRAAERWDDV